MSIDIRKRKDLLRQIDALQREIDRLEHDLKGEADYSESLHNKLRDSILAASGPVLICGGGIGDRFSVMNHDGSDCKGCRTIDQAIEEFRLLARMSGLA